ncbi:hypothetical protein CY34DRAFT_696785 [Suillus luteus UH-Slu-Lm8-n1]|uniref:Uncharacterized protein n=1 Tax=Suillus luteus UH-Slu-Lm8-n1 TaxID=930992 RepID=A0A0C9Z7Q2_9AGAM|nr:hypothetical protein CY34DRAFT_696785 [Suillus luteus UH-Slu-Lm8-n1]
MSKYTRKEVFNSDLTDTSIVPCCHPAVVVLMALHSVVGILKHGFFQNETNDDQR